MKRISTIIASLGGVGFIPFAPGTWGSAVAVVLALPFFMPFFIEAQSVGFLWGATALAYLLGLFVCKDWLVDSADDDPSAIIIDELVGQWLTLAIIASFMPITYLEFLAAFILFRFFDIVKPFPIGWVDKNIKGAQGVMLDDVLAGIMAGALYLIILHIL